MKLKTKLNLLLYVPLTFTFVANGIVLYLAGTPGLMVANYGTFVVVLIITKSFSEGFIQKFFKTLEQLNTDIETVTFTSKLLNEEIQFLRLPCEDFDHCRKVLGETQETLQGLSLRSEAFSDIYGELKKLLITSMQLAEKEAPIHGKAHLAMARELGRVCAETRNKTYNFNDLISSSLIKVTSVSEKIDSMQESIVHTELPSIITENLFNQATRLALHLAQFDLIKKTESAIIQKVPFRSRSLKKAIKLADKRAA